eukprot:5177967-Karenia_brevis.AAC.1
MMLQIVAARAAARARSRETDDFDWSDTESSMSTMSEDYTDEETNSDTPASVACEIISSGDCEIVSETFVSYGLHPHAALSRHFSQQGVHDFFWTPPAPD